ncbi:SseB family protein [Candidatus Venteria ishoeyi]|uniref:Enhanced serine sensitivity protein SseB n=1 Tax=Candidatus Venteria ishoeyi TaxID=1899563 RepID=A0A1H6FGQ5_9GAMM|nr:SseB family protein [Candidatus Venteria ishoeyi]MDM8545051.1 SseB family protein [Candidatus Venteria ishoeyi]SEH08184.1 enhanced serine sensitivity protein SseB [Candidatus Venteria ishoeyi]
MQTEDFKVSNDLEKKLVQAQEGEISGEQFMLELLDTQVFMPVYDKHQVAGLQTSKNAVPLSLKSDDGEEAIAVFTSPDRAQPIVADFPGYGSGGLLVEFKWVLEKVAGGYGVVLNPGWPVGIELASEMVEQLRQNPQGG